MNVTKEDILIFQSRLLQPSQPPADILHLSNTWISVLPEGEEFLVNICSPGYLYSNHILGNILCYPNLLETKHTEPPVKQVGTEEIGDSPFSCSLTSNELLNLEGFGLVWITIQGVCLLLAPRNTNPTSHADVGIHDSLVMTH